MEELTNYQPMSLLGLIIALAFYECVFTGGYLVFKKSVRHQANRYLGISLLMPAIILLPGLLSQLQLLEQLPHVIHIHFIVFFLFGPLLYLYVRACTQKDFRLQPKLWLHFIPALIGLIYFFPLGETKSYFSNM